MMQSDVYLLDGEEFVITENNNPVCDGGGPLGHPREFLTLGSTGEAICKYCDRHYISCSHPFVSELREKGQLLSELKPQF